MKIDKIKKLKRQGKAFSVLSKIFTIVLGIILVLVLFGIIATQVFLYWGFGTLILTLLASMYVLPVLGILLALLLIMYTVKMLIYRKPKGQMIFRTVLSTIVLISILIVPLCSFIIICVSLSLIPYIALFVLSIIALIFWNDNISKQYKLLIEDAINTELEKQDSPEHLNSITEDAIIKSGRKKIIIASIAIIVFIILLVIVIAIAMDIKKAKEEKEKEISENILSGMTSSSGDVYEQKQVEEYKYFADDKNGVLVQMKAPFRDRYIVEIYKTEDGGENWNKIDTNVGGVYVGTEFLFINENIGFFHDPHGGVDSYGSLEITTDGGYTWNNVKVNKPDSITENNIFFNDLPKQEGDKLTVVAYTVRLTRYPNEKYYEFESTDSGITWDYVRVLEPEA